MAGAGLSWEVRSREGGGGTSKAPPVLALWSVLANLQRVSQPLAPNSPGQNAFPPPNKISPNPFLWACHLPRLSPSAVTGHFKCGAPVNSPHLLTALAQETPASQSGQACPPPGQSPSFYHCPWLFSSGCSRPVRAKRKGWSQLLQTGITSGALNNPIAQVTPHRSEYLDVGARNRYFF